MRRRGKVVQLADARLAPQQEVVGHLQTMLDRAKSGELRAVAIAGVVSGGGATTGWSCGDMRIADIHYATGCLMARIVG